MFLKDPANYCKFFAIKRKFLHKIAIKLQDFARFLKKLLKKPYFYTKNEPGTEIAILLSRRLQCKKQT